MPRQIYIAFNLIALFIITYIVVDTFYNIVGLQLNKIGAEKRIALKAVEKRTDASLQKPEYTMIVERNIFGATEKVETPPPVEEPVEQLENLEETSLQLSLLGTIAGDANNSRAIILDERTRSQDLYRVGDSVQGAEIRQILRGKVVLRHGEKDEILSMVEGSSSAEADNVPGAAASGASRSRRVSRAVRRARTAPAPADTGGAEDLAQQEIEEEVIPIDQEILQSSINNLNELLTQVRVRPYFRQGKPEGLIVSQIQGDSIFAKLGLMNGDIIVSVNGQQMSTPEEAFQLYNSLKSGSPVNIQITRRGQPKILAYEIQ